MSITFALKIHHFSTDYDQVDKPIAQLNGLNTHLNIRAAQVTQIKSTNQWLIRNARDTHCKLSCERVWA
ncbi:MAG TPA: hypothetical protein VK642_13120 [Burkholderiales bacterium]|nr:hypothetical protein [Burkholderiales bacterium]